MSACSRGALHASCWHCHMAELLAEVDALFADQRAEAVDAAVVEEAGFQFSGFAAASNRYCEAQSDAATLMSATAVVLQQPLAGTVATVYWMLREVFAKCGPTYALVHDWLRQGASERDS